LFFSAQNNSDGYEPWISDGTEQGTFMVKDIRTDGSSLRNHNDKQSFFLSNNLVYFSANDGIHGFEPWVSNGTEQGTFMLKDIITEGNGTGHNEEGGSSNSRFFTELNNYVYFIANSALWKTDGTQSGTEVIYSNNNLGYLNKVNNKLLFYANGSLWLSDGTTNGTSITELPSYLNINSNIEVNNELYFISRLKDVSNRYGLYKTNGTKDGTVLLYEGLDHPTFDYVRISDLTKCSIYIYFRLSNYYSNGNPELWRTDGVVTEKVDSDTDTYSINLTCHKNNLFYNTNATKIKLIPENSNEPYVLNINITSNDSFSDYADSYHFTSSGDNLYFSNPTDLSGFELFVITPDISTLNTNPFQDQIESNKLNIFPNPTRKIINIKSQTYFNRITIYNLNGRLIINEKIENTLETKLNVDSLTKGIYLIEIISSDKKHFQKLIIE
jgi:ELWxxDGT repeat protein